jgi:DnaJ-domain-containing protein 1
MGYHLRTQKSWDETLRDLRATFDKWGIAQWEVEPRRPPRTKNQQLSERRVRLVYTKDGAPIVLTMDRQDRAVDNLRVLYLAVEAMRLNEARGIAEVVASAYAQLPPPGGPETVAPAPLATEPYAVLGIAPSAPLAVAEAAYRTLVKAAHPDAGGDVAAMQRLNAAIAAIREQKGDS